MSNDYSPTRFYVEGSDTKGHGRQIRMHPESHGMVSVLLANPDLPYKTHDDFVRDAVYHRWQWLADNTTDPEIVAQAQLLRSLARMEQIKRQAAGERKLLDEVRSAISGDASYRLSLEDVEEAVESVETPPIREALEHIAQQLRRQV